MVSKQEWAADPLVQVQKAIAPVQWLGHDLLINASLGIAQNKDTLLHFETAANMLRDKGPQLMRGYGVHIAPADLDAFGTAADEVDTIRRSFIQFLARPYETRAAQALHQTLTKELLPTIDTAIDRYRGLFISLVIERQHAQKAQTVETVKGLARISKQIFFISINASVEAARVGDAGRGFLQISTDIRALAQSAQSATQDLSNLVDDTA
ncbi:hypothetical protein C1J03_21755 [Sulfitobacter sp. SK012]|uniref:methyl-accepting chemotaxis protein n=1 Tax=Sulfitobacter sp. SK012 TaxID=1389005 RepID=UPI000E0A3E4C|nr:methyl-accepting chemotaxis protein [Sulfitobacter sp. SK012]AXI48384.1 hypothetical protein C1J03_21755 [Sulfitobacter sp. SK012]